MIAMNSLTEFQMQKSRANARLFLYLAGVGRLELTTCGFGDRRSTNWSYTPVDETHYA